MRFRLPLRGRESVVSNPFERERERFRLTLRERAVSSTLRDRERERFCLPLREREQFRLLERALSSPFERDRAVSSSLEREKERETGLVSL